MNNMNPNTIQDRAAYIVKCFGQDINIQKSEGSRGGKIIGHTKSGKPIYEDKHATHEVYHDFNSKDHQEAGYLHGKEARNVGNGVKRLTSARKMEKMDKHYDLENEHYKMSDKK